MRNRIELHAHTDISNIRLLDSLNKVDDLIQTASDYGLQGISITDHESVGNSLKATLAVKKKKEQGKIPKDFKLILGNEIYLVESLEEVRDNYVPGVTKYPHFLLLARSAKGHEGLRVLSSKAWEQGFMQNGMWRVPTTMAFLEETMKEYKGEIIAGSACLGSSLSIYILNDELDKARKFIKWCVKVFGKEYFYLEMQPSNNEEQKKVNRQLVKFSKEFGLDLIITNDVHYLRPEDADIHEAFLNAKDGDREVKSFYESTYIHTDEEIREKMTEVDDEIITQAFANTLKIGDMVEEYSLEHETVIPRISLPKFELKHIFKKGYDKYEYIKNMAYSKDEQDKYLLHLIEKGFLEKIPYNDMPQEKFYEYVARVDIELKQLWEMSIKLNQAMSSYYVTVSKIAELIWGDDECDNSREEGSLLGVGRGSASSFLINFLTGITSIDPLKYDLELPYWRHLDSGMSSISSLDVDLDISPDKREFVFDRIKKSFGKDRVIQVSTYGTEKSKSAVQTACRGLGYDLSVGRYLASLIPFHRGENHTISECLYGDKEKGIKPVKEFINEIEKYPRLKETALKIEGLIKQRGVHPGGVLVLNESYTKSNALMRAPNGTPVTQYNLDDSQATGSIKYDILSIDGNSKLQESLNLLLDNGEVEWQGSLRKTFEKYFHPNAIDVEDENLYNLASSGEVPDLFQFSTQIGSSTIQKAKPSNLIELSASNSLMRLQSDSGEQPIDTFVRFKEDISQWYDEMSEYGLNNEEVKLMENHLLKLNGVADTQESVMLMSMDENIAGFTIAEATQLRKTIAKNDDELLQRTKNLFYEKGKLQGSRKELLDYVWNVQIGRMLGYAFSSPHVIAYTLIAMQQLNLNTKFSPVYWQTAVLTTNSGALETRGESKPSDKDYGKMASAIGDLQNIGVRVELPLINSAGFGFVPDAKNNRIIFSLKGITSMNDDATNEIINNRPYSSFKDFHERMYLTKKVTRSQILNLIKAGSFNEFGTPQEIMREFMIAETPVKNNLNGRNLPKIIELGLLNSPDRKRFEHYYNIRKSLRDNVVKKIKEDKNRWLKLHSSLTEQFFMVGFTKDSVVSTDNGSLIIDEKLFEKEYKELMLPMNDLYKDSSFISSFNNAQYLELWKQHASGTVESWEMEAVNFYSDKHEMSYLNKEFYNIKSFYSLSEEPIVVKERESKNGRVYKEFELTHISGTVVDKNSNSHTVSLLTEDSGVIPLKFYSSQYANYDRQIKRNGKIVEKSWFSRGNRLIISGFRRDNQFVVRAPYKQNPVHLVHRIDNDGMALLQQERDL